MMKAIPETLDGRTTEVTGHRQYESFQYPHVIEHNDAPPVARYSRAQRGRLLAGVDVRTLGVKGDGTVEDTAAFQAALDAGQTDLHVPQGEYLMGGVTLPAGTRLLVDPRARIKINPEKIGCHAL
ncbi:MAG: Pectate lyase superfamily protein [Chthoniobacter sp.]|jgi:polygalacturonase|nr:Pectate lyase superfamily protein [Chthoniobacter sp.]